MSTADDIDIMSAEAIADPYSYFAPWRDTQPVVWAPRVRSWLVLSHAHVTAALRDPRFSSDRISPYIRRKLSGDDVDPLVRQAFEVLADWLVFKEGADHTRLRGLLAKAFTAKAVAAIRERVQTVTAELIAAAPRDAEFDLLEAIARPLPSIVIAEMLGVPPADRDRFQHWSELVATVVSAGLDDPGRYKRAGEGMQALVAYFRALIARYEKEPADNLISALIQARDDHEAVSEAELVATCTLILFGGHETTANLIGNSVLALLRHPEQLALLRAGDVDPQKAVEEFLRYDGPGRAVVRLVGEDMEFAGQQMKAGQRVFLVLAAANHDPQVYPDPDRLALGREQGRHIAFGIGRHICMGAPLARLEASIAIPEIVKAFPKLSLATPNPKHQQVFLTRGLQSLPVKPF